MGVVLAILQLSSVEQAGLELRDPPAAVMPSAVIKGVQQHSQPQCISCCK